MTLASVVDKEFEIEGSCAKHGKFLPRRKESQAHFGKFSFHFNVEQNAQSDGVCIVQVIYLLVLPRFV